MDVQQVPAALRARLGVEATDGLVELFGATREEWEAEVTSLAVGRFERRLTEELSALRVEMARGFADLRREITDTRGALRDEILDTRGALREQIAQGDVATRAELLKWSFLFWIGQVVAMTAILSVLLRR